MNWIGTIIDDRYKVNSKIDSHFGMSEIFFVSDLHNQFNEQLVLKICTYEDYEYVQRFRREIRLLNNFQGNSRIVQVLDSNPDYFIGTLTPYFVMRLYPNGDLTQLTSKLINNYQLQENVFNQMILCISELHSKNIFHRDIKPQNFLIDEQHIVVSDFGLGVEPDSVTHRTVTNMRGGSEGYMPPEFYNGGFKNADARSDIYMLGKSFYNLITNRHPTFLSPD